MKDRCEIDETRSVEQMASSKDQMFDKVPAGFKVDNRFVAFIVTPRATQSRKLPLATFRASVNLLYGYKGIATCRVQDLEGNWWLAARAGSILLYIPEEDTETQAKYRKDLLRGREQRKSLRGN